MGLAKLIGTALLAFLFPVKNNLLDYEGKIFHYKENEKYLIGGYVARNIFDKNPEVKDYIYALYDLDSNGVVDHNALYKIIDEDENFYRGDSLARILGEDFDENGIVDIFYFDTDSNGTLETTIDLRKHRKSPFKENGSLNELCLLKKDKKLVDKI